MTRVYLKIHIATLNVKFTLNLQPSVPDLKSSLPKEMATHSYILAWKIPWMDDPGRLLEKKLAAEPCGKV